MHGIGPDSVNRGNLDLLSLKQGERPVAMALTASGNGCWIFTNLGKAVPFGDAPNIGDVSDIVLAAEVVDATPFPPGFSMVGGDGGVLTPPGTGSAVPFLGSLGSNPPDTPIQSGDAFVDT